MVDQFTVETQGQGLLEITGPVQSAVGKAKIVEGLCTVFVRHTSASLVIQENADPSAQRDLERWLDRLVPEFIAKLPPDIITGEPLKYQRANGEYTLYSVGWNGTDDGGSVSPKQPGEIVDLADGDWAWRPLP